MKRAFCVLTMAVSLVGGLSMAPAAAADARLYAVMTGAAERPGPGDPDAVGQAYITIDDSTDTLCLTLQYTRVDGTPSGLHIHLAPSTAAGPVVVPFSTPQRVGSGVFTQCVTVEDEELLDDIAARPRRYYINLHSSPSFGPGAIRGQLRAI